MLWSMVFGQVRTQSLLHNQFDDQRKGRVSPFVWRYFDNTCKVRILPLCPTNPAIAFDIKRVRKYNGTMPYLALITFISLVYWCATLKLYLLACTIMQRASGHMDHDCYVELRNAEVCYPQTCLDVGDQSQEIKFSQEDWKCINSNLPSLLRSLSSKRGARQACMKL